MKKSSMVKPMAKKGMASTAVKKAGVSGGLLKATSNAKGMKKK